MVHENVSLGLEVFWDLYDRLRRAPGALSVYLNHDKEVAYCDNNGLEGKGWLP